MPKITDLAVDATADDGDLVLIQDVTSGKTRAMSFKTLSDKIVANASSVILTQAAAQTAAAIAAAQQGSTTTPPAGGGSSGGVSNPAPVVTPAPAADPVVFTQGSNTFSSVASLSDWAADSPVTAAGESMTVVASGSHPLTSGSPALKLSITKTNQNQVGLNKDLSKTQTRDFKFKFAVDSGATIDGEQTIFHCWTDSYAAGLVQIRIAPAGSGFKFLLRAAGAGNDNFASQVRPSNVVYAKNTAYTVELFMGDRSFSLLVNGKVIIDWYNGTGLNGAYYQHNNVGKYIGGIALGKFYSTAFAGSMYFQSTAFYQDYVPPTGPTTELGKLQDAYAGWKARYLRADGAVVRPNPEGANGIYQPYSDVVSEGTAYAQFFAVQLNDVATFDLVEAWNYANLDRRNLGMGTATNLMGWHYDDTTSTIYDKNFATDADIDRLTALIWAARRKTRGDAGWATSTINYKTRWQAIAADLKQYAFRIDSSNNNAYFATDSFQLNADPMEINLSYLSIIGFRLLKEETGDTFWDQAIAGCYDLINKSSTATLNDNGTSKQGDQVGVGLVPDWCGYSVSSHTVTKTPPNSRAVKFSYDAYRTNPRVYWDLYLYGSAAAKSFLTGPLRTFYLNQLKTGQIYSEYNHDGTVFGAYKNSGFTSGAYLTLLAGGSGDTEAKNASDALYASDLAGLYKKNYVGGFYADNPGDGGAPSYFTSSWCLFLFLIKNGQFVSFK